MFSRYQLELLSKEDLIEIVLQFGSAYQNAINIAHKVNSTITSIVPPTVSTPKSSVPEIPVSSVHMQSFAFPTSVPNPVPPTPPSFPPVPALTQTGFVFPTSVPAPPTPLGFTFPSSVPVPVPPAPSQTEFAFPTSVPMPPAPSGFTFPFSIPPVFAPTPAPSQTGFAFPTSVPAPPAVPYGIHPPTSRYPIQLPTRIVDIPITKSRVGWDNMCSLLVDIVKEKADMSIDINSSRKVLSVIGERIYDLVPTVAGSPSGGHKKPDWNKIWSSYYKEDCEKEIWRNLLFTLYKEIMRI